ncbi:hypothetical protein ACFSBT_20620, partial [Halomarina rubra]
MTSDNTNTDGTDSTLLRRRTILKALGGTAAAATALTSAATGDGEQSLSGGAMLNQPFKVADGVWLGPDSAKDTVSKADGNLYMATDTSVDYYAENDSWNSREVGSNAQPVPAVHTERLSVGPGHEHVKPSEGT